MRVNVESIEIEIDGTCVELSGDDILVQALFLAKVMFLMKWDPRLTLEQLPRLCDSLPDSVYWEVLHCHKCAGHIEFNDTTLRAWTFDELADGWTCPDCSNKDEDENAPTDRIAETANQAAAKAAAIDDNAAESEEEADGDECPHCGAYRPDGDYCQECGLKESEQDEDADEEPDDEDGE